MGRNMTLCERSVKQTFEDMIIIFTEAENNNGKRHDRF